MNTKNKKLIECYNEIKRITDVYSIEFEPTHSLQYRAMQCIVMLSHDMENLLANNNAIEAEEKARIINKLSVIFQ